MKLLVVTRQKSRAAFRLWRSGAVECETIAELARHVPADASWRVYDVPAHDLRHALAIIDRR